MEYLKCLQDVRAYYIPRVLRMREGGADGARVDPCAACSAGLALYNLFKYMYYGLLLL